MKKSISVLLLLALCVFAFAACNKNNDTLKEAGEYLYGIYKDDSEVTPSDYDVAGRVTVGDKVFTVEWSVDVTEGVTIKESTKEGFYTVDVNEKTDKDISYVLTATIKDEKGNSVQKTFNRKVPKYTVATYAQYAAAEDDTALVVEGIVAGIFSKSNGSNANGLYLQDLNGEGGYYLYNMEKDPSADLGIKVGMTLSATGKKDTYNGTYELVSATVEIIDSTVKTVEPVDYTEVFKNASALTDEALVGKQSMLVTIKGVEITGSDESNGYYKFKLGNLETYIRISSSNNCISKDEITAVKAAHGEHFSYSANVTGIVSLYSGSFYLIPASADVFEYLSVIEKTPAEKVQIEKDGLSLKTEISKSSELELALTGKNYSDVAISWSIVSDENGCAKLDGGKLAINLQKTASTLKVKATITCGDATDSVEFEISVAAIPTKVAQIVDSPVVGTPYKFMLSHTNLGKDLYINGEMSGYYYATTESADEAVDVYLEEATGGYYLYCMKDGKKQYLNIIKNGQYNNVTFTDAPASVFTYDATLKTVVTTLENTKYAYGTSKSGTYTTFSANNMDKYAESTCIAHFVELVEAGPHTVEAPVENTAYKFMLAHGKLEKNFYLTGAMNGYYYETTTNVAEAVDVYLEAVTDGYSVYCMKDGKKQYMNIVKNGTYINVTFTDTPTSVFTYDTTLMTVVTEVEGTKYIYGTNSSKTYETISSGKADDSANLFIAHFITYVGEIATEEPEVKPEVSVTVVDTPAEKTAYKFMLTQEGLSKNLFITGEMNGYYFATTSDTAEAVDVYLEKVADGYNLYCMKGDKKQYMNIIENGQYINVTFTDTPTSVFTYDATLKTVVTKLGEESFLYGTSGTYSTFSANNVTKEGVYVAHFVTVTVVEK